MPKRAQPNKAKKPRRVWRRIAVGVHGAEHMVVCQQSAVAESLGRLGEIADDRRIRADLRRREHHPEVRLSLLFTLGSAG